MILLYKVVFFFSLYDAETNMPGYAYRDILNYWFGDKTGAKEVIDEKSSLWWNKNKVRDQEIIERFGALHAELTTGSLDSWKEQPHSRLALIILADQLSRNMYRGESKSFAQDPLALGLAITGIEAEWDKQLRWIERMFFYMPLEHSESLAMQEQSVRLFRDLADIVPGPEQDLVYGYIDFAIRHWEIIDRFGRFPHRNAILDRESSPEEIEFLQQPGSGF